MARSLSTYEVPFNLGGLNHSPNIDKVPAEAMVHPSRNINLHEDGRGPRGGTSKFQEGYGGVQIMGQYDFIMQDGTQFLVVATTDGKIWQNKTTTIKTGLTAARKSRFEVLNNELYICNGADVPQVWDGVGAGTSDLANVPTDWTGASFPAWMVKHGRGLSERLWAGGCGGTPNTIYASKLNNGVTEADFSNAEVRITYIETGNDGGLTGAVEFGDRLIMFSSRRMFLYEDTDTNPDNWGYDKAQFEYGVATFDLVVETPNDLIGMMEDGTIYSVTTVESYGDYKAASLTRPAYIDRWIRTYIDLTKIDQFHAVYDPKLRAIKFFMVYKGQLEITMALLYFIDRGPMDGWIPHDNQTSDSGYSASASCLYKAGPGDYKILTGDYDGNVWELETADNNDDSNGFYAGFKTPNMTFGDPRRTKRFVRGWILCQPKGVYNLSVNTFVDGRAQGVKAVDLSGTGDVYGTALYGTALYGGNEIINKNYDTGNIGRRIQREFFNSNADEPFFISSIEEDFTVKGSRPV